MAVSTRRALALVNLVIILIEKEIVVDGALRTAPQGSIKTSMSLRAGSKRSSTRLLLGCWCSLAPDTPSSRNLEAETSNDGRFPAGSPGRCRRMGRHRDDLRGKWEAAAAAAAVATAVWVAPPLVFPENHTRRGTHKTNFFQRGTDWNSEYNLGLQGRKCTVRQRLPPGRKARSCSVEGCSTRCPASTTGIASDIMETRQAFMISRFGSRHLTSIAKLFVQAGCMAQGLSVQPGCGCIFNCRCAQHPQSPFTYIS